MTKRRINRFANLKSVNKAYSTNTLNKSGSQTFKFSTSDPNRFYNFVHLYILKLFNRYINFIFL